MNRKGSYVDNPAGPQTYEFLVDLPPVDLQKIVYPVGSTHPVGAQDATEMYPLNSLAVRPRLLQRVDVVPFASVANQAKPSSPPKVELVRPPKDERGLYQAKVTIDVGAADVYGIVLSLGWFDPGAGLATSVKRVRIKFDRLEKHALDHDFPDGEEWALNVGVNGRWFQFLTKDGAMHNNASTPLGAEIVLNLHLDDYVTYCAHGAERDAEDDYMRRPMTSPSFFTEDRTFRALDIDFIELPDAKKLPSPWNQLKIPTNMSFGPIAWDRIDIRPAGQTESTESERKKISSMARDFGYQGILLADRHNDMLGRIAPERQPTRVGDAKNQIQLKELIELIGIGKPAAMRLTAYEWDDMRDSAEAQFHLNSTDGRESIRDYTLHFTVTVEEPT